MYGIITAESRYIGENADVVPDKAVSPALEQQNPVILEKMLM